MVRLMGLEIRYVLVGWMLASFIFYVKYSMPLILYYVNICYYRYFQAGGNPEQVIELLSHNYSAVAQMANLLAEWLILGGELG